MPGVFRPYTLVDVLGTINENNAQQQTNGQINGLGAFVEADETLGAVDSVTTTVQTNPAWDAGQWGAFTWG